MLVQGRRNSQEITNVCNKNENKACDDVSLSTQLMIIFVSFKFVLVQVRVEYCNICKVFCILFNFKFM